MTDLTEHRMQELGRTIEALLFLSPRAVSTADLAGAIEAEPEEIEAALAHLAEQYVPGRRGLQLRELEGGWLLATDPATESAARRLLSPLPASIHRPPWRPRCSTT